jgi:RNA polymerase sigma-B factor
LAERERTILYFRFFRGLTQSQIAERLGISQMHVSRILSRTLTGLREALGVVES